MHWVSSPLTASAARFLVCVACVLLTACAVVPEAPAGRFYADNSGELYFYPGNGPPLACGPCSGVPPSEVGAPAAAAPYCPCNGLAVIASPPPVYFSGAAVFGGYLPVTPTVYRVPAAGVPYRGYFHGGAARGVSGGHGTRSSGSSGGHRGGRSRK